MTTGSVQKFSNNLDKIQAFREKIIYAIENHLFKKGVGNEANFVKKFEYFGKQKADGVIKGRATQPKWKSRHTNRLKENKSETIISW